jgi:hypothetical protein
LSSLVQELAAKACFDSLAEACLGVGGQDLLRSWLPRHVQELAAKACFDSLAEACLGVGVQALFRSWLPRPVW